MEDNNILAVVLAGGKSKRFGDELFQKETNTDVGGYGCCCSRNRCR